MIFLAGPGHGAPGVLAPIYLEGTYSKIYPEKSPDEKVFENSSNSSRSRAALEVTALQRLQVPFTKAGNWDMSSRMPAEPRLTIPS